MRSIVGVAFAMVACQATHDPNAVSVETRDCYTCHKPDYIATESWPVSSAYPTPIAHSLGCATTCADCHDTPTATTPVGTGWINNLGGCAHPEQNFPLQASPHSNIACRTCHSKDLPGTSVMGANTDCISCHPNDATMQTPHDLNPTYTYSTTVHNFCLSCHPMGLAGKHPENIFPSSHHGSQCNRCHDMSISTTDYIANANCMASGCHVLTSVEKQNEHQSTKYMGAKTSPVAPLTVNDFCLTCHTGGGNGGG